MDGAGTRRLGNDLLENKLMKKFLLGTVALIALGATAPALAADMAARPYTKAPAYSAPIYNWTGFYIGGHVGGAFAGDNSISGNDGRFLGGVQGGFDYQFAPTWVFGVGAGLEYMFAPSWSAKVEYQYYNFGSTTFVAGSPLVLVGTSFRDDEHTVKAGINYRFNWGGP